MVLRLVILVLALAPWSGCGWGSKSSGAPVQDKSLAKGRNDARFQAQAAQFNAKAAACQSRSAGTFDRTETPNKVGDKMTKAGDGFPADVGQHTRVKPLEPRRDPGQELVNKHTGDLEASAEKIKVPSSGPGQ